MLGASWSGMHPSPRLNLPNSLSLLRLAGVPLLFVLVRVEPLGWFVIWFVLLGLTDFLDGYLARRWGQTSEFGAMLDAVADIAYYLSAAWFLVWLFPAYVQPNLAWLVLALGLFAVSVGVCWRRAGKVIFLHTHLSRLGGVLVFLVVVASFVVDTTWMIRSVILVYALAFAEATVIFLRHGAVDPDTRSLFALERR